MGIQLPAVEEAIIWTTSILEKVYDFTVTALLSSSCLRPSLNSVGFLFWWRWVLFTWCPRICNSFWSSNVHAGVVPAVAACMGLSSWGCWFTDIADKIKQIKGISRTYPK